MRKLVWLGLILVLAAICADVAGAVGKVAVDPNTPGLSTTEDASEQGKPDPRLTQKISYEAVHKPVSAIVADLAQMTGVTLKAGQSSQDWQVRDRKMNIFVKDVPLGDLMASTARVMKFKWSKNPDTTPPTYRLVQDRKLISKMEAEQSRKQEAFKEEIVARRGRLVDLLGKLSSMSNEEGESLRNKNPYHYQLWKSGAAKATIAIFDEMPDVKDAFLGSKMNIRMPGSQLSSGTKQLLLQAMRGNWPYRQFQIGSSKEFPEDITSRLNESIICLENVPRPFTYWQYQPGSNFGGFGVESPLGHFLVGSFTERDAIGQQMNAEYYLRGAEEGIAEQQEARDQLWKSLNADPRYIEAKKQDNEFNKPFLMLDSVVEHEDDTDLQVKVKLKVDEKSYKDANYNYGWKKFAAVEKAVADASGFSIVSDSFSCVMGDTPVSSEEVKLQDVLNRFAKDYTCNWERHGKRIEFRNRDWFRKRSSQLPDEWIERWKQILVKNGTMTLQEFAQIATLSFEQIEENIMTDGVLNCCTNTYESCILMPYNQALLRLYLRLDGSQRNLLSSENGLSLALLNPDQWQLAAATFQHRHYPVPGLLNISGDAAQSLVLKSTSKKLENGAVEYRFTVAKQEGDLHNWHVRTPVYVAPKEKSPSSEVQKK